MEQFEDIEGLQEFYRQFKNSKLGDLHEYVRKNHPEINLATNKGIAGQVLEAVIGNAPNSNPNPDIKDINVELKALPLRKNGQQIQPKERSKIKSLSYNGIIREEWATCELRRKMEKILFLLYEHPTGKTYRDWEEFIFRGTILYEVEHEDEETVKEDWERIRDKVIAETADNISEGDGKILGACTSGTGRQIPYGRDKHAKQRSYSLKNSYMKFFYEKKTNQQYASLGLNENAKPEDFVLQKLNNELQGKSLAAIVKEYDLSFSPDAKSSFRLLINRVLKIADNEKILELEENGIVMKTVPVDANNRPWEAMSFPRFSLVDLIEEKWDIEENEECGESAFRSIISSGFIFIPIIKEKEAYVKDGKTKKRYKDWKTWIVGKTVYWKASDAEMSTIRKEWREAQEIVKKGVKLQTIRRGTKQMQENNLLKSSNTTIIHIRPHANDSSDIDLPYYNLTQKRIRISWQSFWLNKSFVESKIKA
ncbi:MutH/Sau3AI family endonuclease [Flavobacterium procerum]|uniref:MutH/Sau3AI family endonuclease n=1 Tax=Flavobacterium procerum TaxID=1455569 RepID=A0ABV6BUP7_9FLAO